jgi:hypothetical protein
MRVTIWADKCDHNHNRILSAPDSLSHVLPTLSLGSESSEGIRLRGGRGVGCENGKELTLNMDSLIFRSWSAHPLSPDPAGGGGGESRA